MEVGENRELPPGAGDKIVEAREQLRHLLEIIPQNRNFEILTEGDSDDVSIVLRHQDGRTADLKSFLPRNYRFREGDEYICKHRAKTVEYPKEKVPYNGFLPSLFHEIGHSRSPQGVTMKDIRTGFFLIAGFPQMLAKYITQYREYKKKHGVKAEEMFKDFPIEAFMPKWLLAKTADVEARHERDAWAFALKRLRQLERVGFNVFAGFDNVEMIRTYIDFHLASYEYGSRLTSILAGHGYQPQSRFVRKYAK